ncbi:putative zf-MYND domain-containing protein [Lentinula aciculospora]|uniref:Zf-MYND domain-containing protein n=1 Tax=Lentinula aciculospora TaxID=153920 RepID=A0A9W9A359_9AGAR|nr:putative zf-MYND domain-containing protein [Lentinula aciculospora]
MSANNPLTRYCPRCIFVGENPVRCPKCRTVSYCSTECLNEHLSVHRPMCRSFSPREVWGIKILVNWNDPPRTRFPTEYFQHELVCAGHGSNIHPIFSRGELCPLTQRIGIPLRLYSTSGMHESSTFGPNEIAVKLRVEPRSGFAPTRWGLIDHPGECIVIREDQKPLTKELLEAIYSFVVYLMDYPGIDPEHADRESWAPWEGLLNPSLWHFFTRKYYEAQYRMVCRKNFNKFSPLLCT